ncbi:hypothetical protein MRB53_038342 [Persea americana]|nr:hypothetical protein MRB53_038342 [Persea americana]
MEPTKIVELIPDEMDPANLQIMRWMADRLRREIIETTTRELRIVRRQFDSTTGMSSTAKRLVFQESIRRIHLLVQCTVLSSRPPSLFCVVKRSSPGLADSAPNALRAMTIVLFLWFECHASSSCCWYAARRPRLHFCHRDKRL